MEYSVNVILLCFKGKYSLLRVQSELCWTDINKISVLNGFPCDSINIAIQCL